MSTRFRTSDLDLVSRASLAPLRDALASNLHVVNEYRRGSWWCAGFEVGRFAQRARTPESNARAFFSAIEGLSPSNRARFLACTSRTLDVAFDVDDDDDERFSAGFSAATIARLGKLKIGLRVTLYPERQG